MTLATLMGTFATKIAGLSVDTNGPAGSTSFTQSDGLLAVEGEAPALDRCFDVELVDVGPIQAHWGDDQVQRLGRLDVVVLYDQGPDRNAAHVRIAEDVAKVTRTLERPENYGNSKVQRVTYLGGVSIAQTPGTHRIDVRIPFEALYTETL